MTTKKLLHDIRSETNAIFQGLSVIDLDAIEDPMLRSLLKKIHEKAEALVENVKKIESITERTNRE